MSYKFTKEDLDIQFDAFLKDSVSSEESLNKYLTKPKPKERKAKVYYEEEDDGDTGIGLGLSPSGKSFLKSKPKPDESKEENNSNGDSSSVNKQKIKKEVGKGKLLRGKSDLSLSRESLEDISEKSEVDNSEEKKKAHQIETKSSFDYTKDSLDRVNDADGTGPGFDTLDEMADKQKFFDGIEQSDQSVDYHKLIGDMSGTVYNPADTNPRIMLEDSGEQEEHIVNEYQLQEKKDHSFERDSSHQKPSMLSKVSLLDSMDSTLNTTTSPKVGQSRDHDVSGDHLGLTVPSINRSHTAGTEMFGTNTSKELNDVHNAMRAVGLSTNTTTVYHDQPFDLSKSREQLVEQLFNNTGNGKERPLSEIFNDIEEIESKRSKQHNAAKDVTSTTKSKLTPPVQPTAQKKGSHSQSSGVEDSKHDAGGFDHSHTEDTEVFQPVTSVGVYDAYSRSVIKDKKKKSKTSATTATINADGKGRSKSRNKYGNVQSSGYGRRSPSVSPVRSPTRSLTSRHKQLSQSSPDVTRNKTIRRGTSSNRREQKSVERQLSDQNQHLMSSVDTFTRHLKDHMHGKQHPGAKWSKDEPSLSSSSKLDQSGGLDREQVLLQEIKELQAQWQEVQNENVTLKDEMKSLRVQYLQEIEHIKMEHEEELFKIKQENFVLAAKNQADDNQKEAIQKQLAEDADKVTKERINKLEKEIKEQETLIVGYQQENQRLYNEVKRIDKNTKDTEGSMFKENQKLAREVNQLKELLTQKEYEIKSKVSVISQPLPPSPPSAATATTDAGKTQKSMEDVKKMASLESDLKEVTRQYDMLQRELKTINATKAELDQHIDVLIREREDLKKELDFVKTTLPGDAKAWEEKYKQEAEKIKKKLKWYVENQELLDKNAVTMKAKDEMIERLKKQVDELRTEAGKKLEENRLRVKEKEEYSKKIQDLERQVKEMEKVVRKRDPNSISAMIIAAGAVPDSEHDKDLENRLLTLQDELVNKQSEFDLLLRGNEQKHYAEKVQMEDRISELETQLSKYTNTADDTHPHTHAGALQKELDSTKDRYKKQVTELQAQIEQLQRHLQKANKNNAVGGGKTDSSNDSDLQLKVLHLQREVENKSHEIQVLQKSLERLRKEKLLNVNGVMKNNTEVKKVKSKKTSRKSEENGVDVNSVHFEMNDMPSTLQHHHLNKTYQFQHTSDVNVTDLLKENEYLKITVERLKLSLDQQRVDLRKSLAETEAVVRKSREEYEEKIDTMRECHQREYQKILAEQAVSHSTSKVAELQSKCDAQEVLIRHLKEQLAKNEVDAEQISVLKIKEAALETQIEKLKDELADAKLNYSPGMKHFVSIQEKITQMERRHEKREEELQDVIKNIQNIASSDLDREAEKWRRIVETKNSEIETFRAELDSILNVVRMLQKQGVIIPMS